MIQIDMPMPKRCGVCFAMHTDEIGLESWCGIDETARDLYTDDINTKRPKWCPLKEQEAVEPYSMNAEKTYGICPKCGKIVFRYGNVEENHHYCGICGQEVKWNE